MNNPATIPVVLLGQGAYARAWPPGSTPRQDRETVCDLAKRVLERRRCGNPVSDYDAERLAQAILQVAGTDA